MIINAQKILESTTLIDVISEYVDLKKRGANYMGKCPFHDENSDSFTVSPSKGVFKCFGCGVGGNNPASFIMKKESITFPEALERLSSKSGVKIEYAEGETSEAVRELYRQKRLEKDKQSAEVEKAYQIYIDKCTPNEGEIAGKQYTEATIKKWGLTLIAKDNYLTKSKELDHKTLEHLGLIGSKEGRQYDAYYNRFIFPIHNQAGKIVGFTARALKEDVKPKYINSPESELYDKSRNLYGIYYNAKTIRDSGECLLLEGSTDVAMLDQNNISNAVASCGTALTEEQAKLIAMHCDSVTIIRDGDKAGIKAAERDVEVLTMSQLDASVLILPDKEDPASYVLKHGPTQFLNYKIENVQNGIHWIVSNTVGAKGSENNYKKSLAIVIASRLLSYIKDETLRSQYLTSCSKIIGCKIKDLGDAINSTIDKNLEKEKYKLTIDQESDRARFGIYRNRTAYCNHVGLELSNFMMKPLFLVRGDALSLRVFELIDENNSTLQISANSDELVTMANFQKRIEAYGNFVWMGNGSDYTKLKRLIYGEMQTVHLLPYLGYISSTGIYAWGNGITTPSGEFIPIDAYGKVDYDKVSYYLPAFSNIRLQSLINSEDNSDYEKQFAYYKSETLTHLVVSSRKDDKSTIEELKLDWFIHEFTYLFGDNAVMGLGFYFATIIKDYFQKKYNFFPLLNLFGPPGSGKSTMGLILHSMFGKPINAVHCITATWASFFRRPSQCCNAISYYEEYSEKLDKERQEGLKGFYDGFGRPLAKKESSNKTESQPVLSSILLSGQILPTHDPALLARCITLFFDVIKADAEKQSRLKKLEQIAKEGGLSIITSLLHSKREYIIEFFEKSHEKIKSDIVSKLPRGVDFSTRLILNYSIIFSAYMAITTVDMNYDNVIDSIAKKIMEQEKINDGASELKEFWSMLEYLISKNQIHQDNWTVVNTDEVTVKNDKDADTRITLNSQTDVLYINLNNVHKEYLRECRTQGIQRVLDSNTIKYYLKINHAFIGVGNKKINNKNQRCYLFDLLKIKDLNLQYENNPYAN